MRHSAAENIEKEKNRRQKQYEEEREDSHHRRESERQNLLTSHKKEIARIREEYAEEVKERYSFYFLLMYCRSTG